MQEQALRRGLRHCHMSPPIIRLQQSLLWSRLVQKDQREYNMIPETGL